MKKIILSFAVVLLVNQTKTIAMESPSVQTDDTHLLQQDAITKAVNDHFATMKKLQQSIAEQPERPLKIEKFKENILALQQKLKLCAAQYGTYWQNESFEQFLSDLNDSKKDLDADINTIYENYFMRKNSKKDYAHHPCVFRLIHVVNNTQHDIERLESLDKQMKKKVYKQGISILPSIQVLSVVLQAKALQQM